MRRNRGAFRVDLNFDGLTDSVTNLVGTLVLLLVLLIAVTRQASNVLPAVSPETGQADEQDAEQQEVPRLDLLVAQAEVLREKVRQTGRRAERIESELPALKSQISELTGPSDEE